MEITYKRTGLKTYIVIERNDNNVSGFHEKMITRNHIANIARMIPQNIDGKTYYYYDIQGKISMDALFAVRKMSGDEIGLFLEKLSSMFRELQRYLLSAGDVIYDPCNIWFSLDTMEPDFIYVPDMGGDPAVGSRQLAEYITDKADPEDRVAVELAYDYLESVENGDIIPKNKVHDQVRTCDKDFVRREDQDISDLMTDESWKLKEGMDEDMRALLKDEERKQVGDIWIFVGLGISVASCAVYIAWVLWPDIFPFTLTDDEYMIIGISIAVAFAVIIILSVYRYNHIVSKKRVMENEEREELISGREEDPEDEMDYLSGTDMTAYKDERTVLIKRPGKGTEKDVPVPLYPTLTAWDGRVIELKRFPFVLGKMRDRVDELIESEGISRLHAMIKETDGRYYLSDLNSLNGTFINGDMIGANAMAEISDGDVISLADISFTFQTGKGNQAFAESCILP